METEKEKFTRRALKVARYLNDPIVEQVFSSEAFTPVRDSKYADDTEWNRRMDVFIIELEKLDPEHPLLNQIR